MAVHLDTRCGVCGAVASRITLLAAGELPVGHEDWDATRWETWRTYYADRPAPRIVYSGIEAGSGSWGTEASEQTVERWREILTPPLAVHRIRELELHDDASVCIPCGMPYCAEHWSMRGGSSLGICPRDHYKSLDPF